MINDRLRGKQERINGNVVGDESLQKQIPACPSCVPAHTPTQKIKAWIQTIKHTNLAKTLVDAKVSMCRIQFKAWKGQRLSVSIFSSYEILP